MSVLLPLSEYAEWVRKQDRSLSLGFRSKWHYFTRRERKTGHAPSFMCPNLKIWVKARLQETHVQVCLLPGHTWSRTILERICLLISEKIGGIICLTFLPCAFFWGKGRQRTWTYLTPGLWSPGPSQQGSTLAMRTELCPAVPPHLRHPWVRIAEALPLNLKQNTLSSLVNLLLIPECSMRMPCQGGTFLPFRS